MLVDAKTNILKWFVGPTFSPQNQFFNDFYTVNY